MVTTDRFSRREFQRMLDVTEKTELLGKIAAGGAAKKGRRKILRFSGPDYPPHCQTIDQKRSVSAAVAALHRGAAKAVGEVKSPLTELRIRANGRNVIVERAGVHQEPISGQTVLNFEIREPMDKVRVMPQHTADDWVALGVEREQYESEANLREASEAYQRALNLDPSHVDALNNLGMLSYEQGNLEDAAILFRRATQLHPQHVLSHFNLGSVLEESGKLEKARKYLRVAVRLDPQHADAHYNLAFVCDRLGALAEARRHWRRYLELDPHSSWANYARRRLAPQKSGN